jgi:hypothetical protein
MHLLSMELIHLKKIFFLISTNHKQIVQMAFMLYLIITKDGIFVDNLSLFLQNMVPLGQAIWKKIKM